MSKRLEWTIKGFIIGAVLEWALRVVLRFRFGVVFFILRFWWITLPLIALIYVSYRISYRWNKYAERDAIYGSFDKTKVTRTSPRAIMTTGFIDEVADDLTGVVKTGTMRFSHQISTSAG